ncbi:MAG: hypothetical protein ABIP78_01050 [Pyrinomonadaceae bacterium]
MKRREIHDNLVRTATVKIVIGLLFVMVSISIGEDVFPEFLSEWNLINSPKTTQGHVYETNEHTDCEQAGCTTWWTAHYSFSVPIDSKSYEGTSFIDGSLPATFAKENLPQPAVIEYLEQTPRKNRIKGSAFRSVLQLFNQYLFLYLVISLIAFVSGVLLAISGGKTIWIAPRNPTKPIFSTITSILFFLVYGTVVFYLSIALENILGMREGGFVLLIIPAMFGILLFAIVWYYARRWLKGHLNQK